MIIKRRDAFIHLEGRLLTSNLCWQLLYHLFNHVPLSPLQYALDPQLVAQPTIYRMLNYRPPPHLDATSSYAKACGDLLRAFGDADLGYEGLSDILARTGITLLEILVPSLAQVEAITPSDVTNIEIALRVADDLQVAALINVLTLLSTAAWLFPPLIIPFTNLDLDIGGLLKFTVNRVFADQATLERLKEKISMPDWPRELAERVADLAGAICWFGDGSLWFVMPVVFRRGWLG